MNLFKKKPTPKEAAKAAKKETRREVRVRSFCETACGSRLSVGLNLSMAVAIVFVFIVVVESIKNSRHKGKWIVKFVIWIGKKSR